MIIHINTQNIHVEMCDNNYNNVSSVYFIFDPKVNQ